MPRPATKPRTNVYHYSDFKALLKALVQEFKSTRKGFSMRSFAESAGFGSPSFLKMIIDGKRSVSADSLEKICQAFHIGGKEKEYFELLVTFGQCQDPDEKSKLYLSLNKKRPRLTLSSLKQNQRKYLENDFYSAIREMVLLTEFKEDAKWIAAHCVPRISPSEAREALDVLLELGLLKRNQDGALEQSDPIIDTGAQAEAAEAFFFHEAVLNKARKYLSLLEQENRNFSALTIPIPKTLESEINTRIHQFQNEILDLINQEGVTYDDVFQLNVQFFPVTNTKQESEK